jgi:hypothetical protein
LPNEIRRIETKMNFEKYSDFQHPEITKVEILVAYHGANRNGSFISKDTFEKDVVMQSLTGIPVVGEFWEKSENFKGHGGKLEISDDGIQYVMTTKPYGAVVEPNPRWVEIEEKDGSVNEYLAIDAYLWTGRYEELEVVREKGANQSMEIVVKDGAIIDGEEDVFEIKDFFYSALCILGKDEENPEFNFEPCFESSSIVAYTLDKDDFKSEFSEFMQMVKEFSMEQKTEEFVENGEEEIIEPDDEIIEDEPVDDEEEIVDSEEEDMEKDKEKENYELTHNDKREILYKALNKEYEDAYLVDLSEEKVYFESWTEDGYKYFRQSYVIDENMEVTFEDDKVEVFHSWLTIEEKQELNNMQLRYSEMEKELDELNEFKLEKEHQEYLDKVEETFSKFDKNDILSDNKTYAEIKVACVEEKWESDRIDKEVFALLGALTFQNASKENSIKVFSQKSNDNGGKFSQFAHYAEIAKQNK